MQGKVKQAEKKITELVTKLNNLKHSDRLATGKLPAKWHMPSRIEEDIGKERTKLDELQTELHKLELQASHTQHAIDHGLRYRSEDEMGSNVDDDVDDDDENEEDLDILNVGNLSLGEGRA